MREDEQVEASEGLLGPLLLARGGINRSAELRRDREWLERQIRLKGFQSCKDVFLCTIDHTGKLYISGK